MRLRKYTYRYSAFGRMRDRIATKESKANRVPYKTIMWQTS